MRIARPISDIRNTGWVFTGGYTSIAAVTSAHPTNNSDTAGTPVDPTTADYGEVLLSAITDPGTSDKHYLRVGLWKPSNNRNFSVEFRLMQNTVQIATRTVSSVSTTVPRYFAWELTAAETDAITDYSDLRVRFIPTTSGGTAGSRVLWSTCSFDVAEPVASRVQSTDSDTFSGASIGAAWDFQYARNNSGVQTVIAYPVTSGGNIGASNTSELAVCYRVDRDYIADQQYSEATIRSPYTDADQRQTVFVMRADAPDEGVANWRVDWQWNPAGPNLWEIKKTGDSGVGTVLASVAGSAPQAGDVLRIEARWNASLSRVDYSATLKRGGTTITSLTANDSAGQRWGRPGVTVRSVASGATSFTDWNGGAIDLAGPILATADLRGAASLAGASGRARNTTSALQGVGTLAASAGRVRWTVDAVLGIGALAGSAGRLRGAAVSVGGVGSLAGAAGRIRWAASAIAGTGLLGALSTRMRTISTALLGVGTLAGTATSGPSTAVALVLVVLDRSGPRYATRDVSGPRYPSTDRSAPRYTTQET